MKKLLFGTICALFATEAAAGEITLTALNVKNPLTAGVPYVVSLPYLKTGTVKVKQGCFYWSGEGPYCFKPLRVTKDRITVRLRTNNPFFYQLVGYVEYQADGKTVKSNRVKTKIEVRKRK